MKVKYSKCMKINYLFYFDVSNLSEENYVKLIPLISDYRKNKIENCRNKNNKKLSLCSELLLRYAYRYLGVESKYLFDLNNYGKPYLNDCDLYFNISHCKDYVVCAISSDEIGCDIELISEPNMAIAERYFNTSEYNKIKQLENRKDIKDIFYRYWTLKESFIKNIGYGLSIPLNEFFIVIDESIGIIQNINNNTYYFEEINIDSRYKCSICKLNNNKTNVINVSEKDIIKTLLSYR